MGAGYHSPDPDHQYRGATGAARRGSIGRATALRLAREVAAAIAFLCSDDAAYITGEALNVSGGQTMV